MALITGLGQQFEIERVSDFHYKYTFVVKF